MKKENVLMSISKFEKIKGMLQEDKPFVGEIIWSLGNIDTCGYCKEHFNGDSCGDCELYPEYCRQGYDKYKSSFIYYLYKSIRSRNFGMAIDLCDKFIERFKQDLPQKKGKLVLELLHTEWCDLVRVKEQTNRGKEFFNGSDIFTCSNGSRILSLGYPAIYFNDNDLCVRGTNEALDNEVLLIPNEKYLIALKQAVRELNLAYGWTDSELNKGSEIIE